MTGGDVPHRHADDLSWDDAGERVVILDADGTTITTLNPVGSLLWRRLSQPCESADLVDHLAAQFPDVDRGQLAQDVDEYLAQLHDEGLLTTDTP
jgi:Coenzyme PQQ synthesis protein D (PqqD)